MATTLSKKQGGFTWTLQQAKNLNATAVETATAIDAVLNAQATDAAFTIGDEADDVINVAVELQDSEGTAVESLQGVTVFLSDASTGIGLAATAPDGGWAIGTDGAVIDATVAGKLALIQTDADGTFDLDITESGTDTFYMVVQLPNGKQVVSGAITFAA